MTFKRIVFIFLPIAFALIGLAYLLLGGLSKPEIKITTSPGYVILGQRFTGKADDRKLKELHRDVQSKYKSDTLKGTFCVMHYKEPDEKTGDVDVVIGVIVKDSANAPVKKYKYFYWPRREVIQAAIKAHYSVAPSPETIETQMNELVKTKGYQLTEKSLEKYFGSSDLVVEVPINKREDLPK